MDVVAVGKGQGGTNGQIKWYPNDGSPDDDSWTSVIIDSNIDGAMGVYTEDIDGDNVTSSVAWYKNGVLESSQTSLTLLAAATACDEEWCGMQLLLQTMEQ